MGDRDPNRKARARALRRAMTPAENALWRELRRRRDVHWRRQAPIAGYVADFACLRAKLVVEVDGGAHDHAAAQRRDATRTASLNAHGYIVHRVTNEEVLLDPASVADLLHNIATSRLPSPDLVGGGVGGGGPAVRSSAMVASMSPVERPVPHPQPLPRHAPEEGSRPPRDKPSRKRNHLPSSDAPTRVDRNALVLLGAIAGAHGVRGELKVRSFTAMPESVFAYGPLYDAEGELVLTPQSWRRLKDFLAVTAPEFIAREQAEAARNTPLHVPRSKLPPADEEEYYQVDLIGCRVEALDGAPLGEVVAVHDFGAGDVLELRDGAGAQRFIDFSRAEVPVVDLANRRLVATPIEGEEP